MAECGCSYIIPSFFFNDTATTEIYTLSLHDALPIFGSGPGTAKVPGQSQGPGRSGCHSQCSSGRTGDTSRSVRVHEGQVAHRGDLEGISAISDLKLGGRRSVPDADVAGE